jgi:hypothetical protein
MPSDPGRRLGVPAAAENGAYPSLLPRGAAGLHILLWATI